MAKRTQQYVCENCSANYAQWQGQCSSCKEWNTIIAQEIIQKETQVLFKSGGGLVSAAPIKPQRLASIELSSNNYIDTGLSEFNRVLGQGLVRGSVVLLTGEPGVGKSTLLLELGLNLGELGQKALYISAEEILSQIAARTKRLGRSLDNGLEVVNAFALEQILPLFAEAYDVLIIDSIQTIASQEVRGIPGGASQVRYCTAELVSAAKQLGKTLVLVGHITKDGNVAGPKTLEHLVDVVLHFTGDEKTSLRLLRAQKNRFGSVDEVGIFAMQEEGLKSISNPGEYFLTGSSLNGEAGAASDTAGSCRAMVMEGRRPIVVEIQALAVKTNFALPKRVSEGVSLARVQLLCAVLQRFMRYKLNEYDVYVNVANGFKLTDRGADLALVLAIISSLQNKPLSKATVAYGEVNLSGQIQSVQWQSRRAKEAKTLGFKQIYDAKVAHINKLVL